MEISTSAAALGRLGGLARARTLPRVRRREIAAAGGLARSLSRHAARRVAENFRALAAVIELRRAGRRA